MTMKVLEFIKLVVVYTVFCTMGLFLSIFLAGSIVVLLRAGDLELLTIASLSAKKSFIAGPISAFSILFFLYIHRIFIGDKDS